MALLDRDAREAARQRFLADLEQQVRDADHQGFDIDATVEGTLDLPSLPEPALTLRDLDRAIQIPRARPPEAEFRPLDPGSYGVGLPGSPMIRVTTDARVFEFSSDNFQLFSPGGDAFNAFRVGAPVATPDGRSIAGSWKAPMPGRGSSLPIALDPARYPPSRNYLPGWTPSANRVNPRWQTARESTVSTVA